jgi:hypothetical protein
VTGNHVVIVAGTRDVALANMAEAVSHSDSIGSLTAQSGTQGGGAHRDAGLHDFEALYEVYGMEGTTVASKLLTAVPLNTAAMWKN